MGSSPNAKPPGGFTLTEVMIVVVLAGVVTLGVVGFYLNCQATWLQASTQALAQRDGTGLLEFLRSQVHRSRDAAVLPSGPDGSNHALQLYFEDPQNPALAIWWDATDSLIHYGPDPGQDRGPVAPSVVERFALRRDPALPLVFVDTLRVRSTSGQSVEFRTAFALYNGP